MTAPAVRAVEVPDIRLEFIKQWGRDGYFRYELAHRFRSAGFSLMDSDANSSEMGKSVREAELYWISPAFMPLLLNAANSLPLDSKFSELPPLPPHGLLVFDAPDGWTSGHDDPTMLPDAAALSWSTGTSGVLAEAYARLGNFWVPIRSSSWMNDDSVTVSNNNHNHLSIEGSEKRVQRDRQILGAFAHLITQEFITDTVLEPLPRHAVRRSQRMNVPSTVNVVRLRQIADEAKKGLTTGPAHEYSHQWLVSGHWRNQPCGPERQERKLIWVNPHIKGPADKPLVLKETVKALVR